MRTIFTLLGAMLFIQGCSGDDTTNQGTPDSGSHPDSSTPVDASNGVDSAPGVDAAADTTPPVDAPADAPVDANGCPSSWTVAPAVDPSLVPDGGTGAVRLHASATGTQNYTCTQGTNADGGTTYNWTFTGPNATLDDCNAMLIGHHFASDGGPTAPEWQTLDGTYVIGHKLAAFTPDGGGTAVPWLLLSAASHGGTGTLSTATYIHRLNTTGGVAPAAGDCNSGTVGNTQNVSYTADYYFYGP